MCRMALGQDGNVVFSLLYDDAMLVQRSRPGTVSSSHTDWLGEVCGCVLLPKMAALALCGESGVKLSDSMAIGQSSRSLSRCLRRRMHVNDPFFSLGRCQRRLCVV